MRISIPRALLAAAVAVAAVVAGFTVARANGVTCTAWFGGLETGKLAVPELVVFNTGAEAISLNVTLRSETGATLATTAAPLDVAAFNSLFLSLTPMLATAGTDGRPYVGRFTAEVTGAAPFSEGVAVVHVTQYFGKPAKGGLRPVKPKGAFVVRPLFISVL